MKEIAMTFIVFAFAAFAVFSMSQCTQNNERERTKQLIENNRAAYQLVGSGCADWVFYYNGARCQRWKGQD